ncbi:fibronectin type III domain-containing protein [Flavobacterium sp.]|jgi:gliding motility-associated-like protein|uniref:fibronectin type III domain-containing protein n=1 Tax=Flavobacterium sp. TaxID=239 RepID=UPI0037C0E101
MKKITLLLLFLLSSISSFSQLALEGFENTPGPDALPSTNWTLETGNWAVFDNGVGSTQRWKINSAMTTPASVYQGVNAAYIDRENITSEEFLATPPVLIPINGVLNFYTRMNTSGNQGTIYEIRVAPATEFQDDPSVYFLVQRWTEDQLISGETNFNIYTEKTVDLSAFTGQYWYVSFVKIFSQSGPGPGGDTWFIDNVSIDSACLSPTSVTASSPTPTSVSLTWTNPNGPVTGWEIEAVLATGTPTGVANYTTATFPYEVTGLLPNTAYKFYVRARCTNGISSPWSSVSNTLLTQIAPPVCGGNLVDSGGPGGNYGPNENNSITVDPSTPGDLVTVTFTAFNTQAGSDILRIYDGTNTTFPLLATLSGTTIPPSYTATSVSGSLTFAFTSDGATNASGYAANITCGPPPSCRIPTSLTNNTVTTTSTVLNWIQPTNPDLSVASAWQVLALPCGSVPPTAGATGFVSANSNPFTLTGLTPATCYDIYVRAVCSGPTSSGWSTLPTTINTLLAPPACGGNFVDSGGLAGNYPNDANETTTISPITPGDVVTITFTSFNTQAGLDILRIYDGPNNTFPLLATLSGTTLPTSYTASSATGELTFVFTSNGTTRAAGWVSNIACGPPPTCRKPITFNSSSVLSTSAVLNWIQPVNPDASLATSWHVLALPCGSAVPTANSTGFVIASTNPYTITGLLPLTCYDLYIRAACSLTSTSIWEGPISFTTQVAPPACGGNFVDTGGTTASYAPDANSTTTICPVNVGDVVTVTFTAFDTEDTYDGLYVYNGNSITAPQISSANPVGNINGPLTTAGAYWGDVIPEPFTSTSPNGCLTFNFRSDDIINNAGWIANVSCAPPPTCIAPTAISTTVGSITSSSVILNWTQPINPDGSTATAWQVLALPCGAPLPTATTTGFVNASTNPFTLTGLNSITCYDIYIRAVCSESDSSTWRVIKNITTQVAPPVCGGDFVDVGGPNADYANTSDSTVPICPVNPGDVVTVTFTSFNTEATWDGLYVFDGNSILSPQIPSANPAGNVPGGLAGSYWGDLTGNLPGPFTSTSNDGCLTFRFRSDGSGLRAGWVANVICSPGPNCLKPTLLTSTNITATSASLGWTESNSAVTQWEIIYLPFGQPVPLPTATGVLVTSNPVVISGLLPGTRYTFYVRAICPTSGTSSWSNGASFTTLIINDNCSGAIFAPVNSSNICQQVTPGTITGATASTPGITAPCIGNADDDVWFQFVASNPFLTVSLQNIVGTTTNLNFAVYSGNCGTFTQVFCSAALTTSGVVNGLTIGQTYYIRVYSNASTPQTSNFNLCISTPASCLSGEAACQNLSYQNTTGVVSQGTIGCLNSSPNPTYYTINISNTGPINLLLTQSTFPTVNGVPGTPNLDVDYAAWGPFTSQAAACAAIGNPPTLAPGVGVPVTLTTGCSFSIAPTENLNILNAVAGQIYVILITNFSDDPGFVSLTQTNASSPGAGLYQCCPDAFFSYNPVSYCKSSGAQNPVAVISAGSLAGVFSLSPASPTGLVFANNATGEIDLAASTPGNYLVLNTVAATASCAQKQRGYNISIVAPTSATISYGPTSITSFCKSVTTLQAVTQTGTTGGSYSAIPNVGLSINPTTGEINPSLSSPGIYTVVYGLPGSICTAGNPSTQVEIIALPNIVQPEPIVACYSTLLPPLTVGNYYSQSQLTGAGTTPLDISVPITASQTIYVYELSANGCPNEKSFSVTINTVPTPTYTTTAATCTSATGSVTVTSPIGTSAPTPGSLFISEVTDANTGSLTYVEIYNGTGATVNLANYKLRTFNNGSTTFTAGCDNILSGTLANNGVHVVSFGTSTVTTGVVPIETFNGCTGVNQGDCIKLMTLTNTVVDLWGRTDGVSFTPLNQPGYTYRRLNTATIPSTTWNAADWNAIDPENYSNVGSYSLATSNYEYSLDNGVTYQAALTFNNLAAGDHVLIVKDLITGCLSAPVTIAIGAVDSTPSVTGFTYVTPVCNNATPNPSPDTFTTGFTAGGTFSEYLTTGLVFINTSTGEIDLANSTPGSHTIRYSVAFNSTTCVAAGFTDFTIVIESIENPVLGFSYTTPICQNAQAPFSPTLVTGFTTGGTFSSTTGLSIDATTGVINLTTSTAGSYTITYTDAGNSCQASTSATFDITINPIITPVTTFNYVTPVCQNATTNPLPDTSIAGFTTGGTFSEYLTTGLVFINTSTGEIDLDNSTPGLHTIRYNVAFNSTTCVAAGFTDFTVEINPVINPTFSFGTSLTACQGVSAQVLLPTTSVNSITGSWNPSTIDYSILGQTIYTFTPDAGQCATTTTLSVTVASPILVELTGGCESVNYILTATPVNGSFVPETASYSWQNNAGIEVGTTQSITVTEVDFYTVTITVDGCSTESFPFDVTSVSCVIQKGISVNNDGLNDTFDLSGYDVKKLSIFNRLGMKVYSLNNYVDEWGGNSDDGDELPDGTYYYVIEQRSGTVKTGWIYINRAQ